MRFLVRAIAVLVVAACEPEYAAGRRLGNGTKPGQQDDKAADGTQPGGPIEVGEKPLLRLTRHQYQNIVRDALGVADAPLDALPTELTDGAYYNHASAQIPDDTLIDAYASIATTIATQITSEEAHRTALVGCTPKPAEMDECLRGFVARTAKLLYRRPLDPEDLARLVSFSAKDAADGWDAVHTAIEVMLQSPRMLYRVEPTIDRIERPGYSRFDGYAMASRLALTVLDTLPDDELFALAERDELATPAQLAAQVDRLLATERPKLGASEFYRQWLEIDPLLSRSKDAKVFPSFTPALLVSMREETMALLAEYASSDHPFIEILTADHSFVDGPLAKLYGVSKTMGADVFERVNVGAGRLGLLSHASFLTNDPKSDGTSPTHRGLFVMDRLLCMKRLNPVMVVPVTDSSPEVPKTTRQKMEQIHAIGSCQSCHRQMDGIGFGFEGFDGIGALRTKENGLPIDDTGLLVVGQKETPFRGARELVELLGRTPEVESCLVRHNVRWSLGRDLSGGEEQGVSALARSFVATPRSYKELVRALVQSDFFRLRPHP